MNDEFYMQRCIQLAKKALGNTYPNPLVGAVIVYKNNIIGEGYHHKAGQPHAEINAIASVKNPELLPESTLYVSLEPCSHYGKTPPCAKKIIEIGFKKVVIGTLDAHAKVNGEGLRMIKNAGIEVDLNILQGKCLDLNKRFFTFHNKKRPYIFLKWAESSDHFLDQNFKPTRIGNELTQLWVHRFRAQEQAIFVGTQTAINDNPSLTVRNVPGNNPTRILLDLDLKVNPANHLFNQAAETIIFNSQLNEKRDHLTFIKINRKDNLHEILEHLYQRQIQSVMIEGGASTLKKFIEAQLWDEAFVIKNKELLLKNGTKAPIFPFNPFQKQDFYNCTIQHFYNGKHI